jgi:hypothetical protein
MPMIKSVAAGTSEATVTARGWVVAGAGAVAGWVVADRLPRSHPPAQTPSTNPHNKVEKIAGEKATGR